MFDIRWEPSACWDRGRIRIDEFSEGFELGLDHWSPLEYAVHWRDSLSSLVEGRWDAVALMTWVRRPPSTAASRAWTLFNRPAYIAVQESFFVPGHHDFRLAASGAVVDLAPYEHEPEVSEWRTTKCDLAECVQRLDAGLAGGQLAVTRRRSQPLSLLSSASAGLANPVILLRARQQRQRCPPPSETSQLAAALQPGTNAINVPGSAGGSRRRQATPGGR